MRIRPARESDAARIAELAVELGYPTTADEAATRFETIATAGDNHVVLVAETDAGDIVGWIHGFESLRMESDPFAEIGGLVVAASARGEGVGEALVAEVARWGRGRGQARLRVRSNVVREGARRFYDRLGFRRVKYQVVLDLDLREDGGGSRAVI